MAANPKKSYIDPEEEMAQEAYRKQQLYLRSQAEARAAAGGGVQNSGGVVQDAAYRPNRPKNALQLAIDNVSEFGHALANPMTRSAMVQGSPVGEFSQAVASPQTRDAMVQGAKKDLLGSGPLGLGGGVSGAVDAGTRALYGGAPKAPDYGAMAEADLAPKPAAPTAFQGMGDIRRDESAMPQNKSVSLGGARSRITSVDEDLIHQMQVLDAQRNPQNRAALEAAFGTRGDLVAGRVAARSGMRDIQRAQGGDEAAANRVLTGEEDYLQRSEANRELNREQARLAVNTTKAQAAAAGAAGDPAVLEAKTAAEKARAQAEAARAGTEAADAATGAKVAEARSAREQSLIPLADPQFSGNIDAIAQQLQSGPPSEVGTSYGLDRLRSNMSKLMADVASKSPQEQAAIKEHLRQKFGRLLEGSWFRLGGRGPWFSEVDRLRQFVQS